MTSPAAARYDLRWTRPNVLALVALCVVAGALLARTAARQSRAADPPGVDARRVEAATETINPNLAPPHSLVRLPTIGPARAKAILAYREAHGPGAFRWAGDLTAVKGIGPGTVATIAPYLSLPAHPPRGRGH